MTKTFLNCVLGLMLVVMLGHTGAAMANVSMLKTWSFDHPTYLHDHPFATKHLLVQVSEGDPARWKVALNMTQQVLIYFGQDNLQIVVVAFGPGLKMLLKGSPVATFIQSLNAEGVEFDACHNTMQAMAKDGHLPELVPQAVIVPAGAGRIMQLEQHGFDYIKP
ncbi:DsrE family protein [Acidithiobacillus sp.]|uniref:DsrE family protein n=1 Tax=Acidithiobacillus sp. TaxID=1872118 RepID=UPI0025BCCD87|nr:DsrE family protein [Acidithiobacillus sp.]